MDNKLTEQIGRWLDTPAADRNIMEGAEMLLRLSRNKVRHRNIVCNPAKYAGHIEHELQKFYNFRVKQLTHEQFVEIAREAEEAVQHHLSKTIEAEKSQQYVGRRPDHDSLPAEAREAYEAIPELRARMRDVHSRLRSVSDLSRECLDSDAWPFVNELVSLDKQIRALWAKYDSATAQPSDNA